MSINVQNTNVNHNKGLYVNAGCFLSTSLTENMEGKWPKSQSSPVGSPLKLGT